MSLQNIVDLHQKLASLSLKSIGEGSIVILRTHFPICYIFMSKMQTCFGLFLVLLTVRLAIIVERKTDLMHKLFSVYSVNLYMLYAFFWVIPRRLNFICRRFGTLCLFHLHRQVSVKMEKSVPKRWHIVTFRSWGIKQKEAYNIQNTAKV
jgi:hypothetical protein